MFTHPTNRRTRNPVLSLLLAAVTAAALSAPAAASTHDDAVARGRYLVGISGCNDCHTPGYAEQAGAVPESDRLTGSSVGFQGPWGTSYPTNLRLSTAASTPDAWLQHARSPMRPPMPWFALRDMSDDDLLAIYAYIRSLGTQGAPAPAAAAPGQAVTTPYIEFMPKNLPQKQAMATH
ncbi:MAG: cytochrome c [Nevskiales bacterium]|nr:cytochrome c [Nevskiales bacterium]